ncbi:exported hypothetical protein [Sphingobacterium sp. PM2-P1-29]|nr:exported hypothetical protein [Sphingobacterium sp. PM2-P1-29]
MKKLNIFLAVITLTIFYGCSTSSRDNYIGYWSEDEKKFSKVLEIKKEGDKLYLKSLEFESPAIYNKEDKTLSAEFSNGLSSITLILNLLDDPEKMKMSIGNKSTSFSKISKEEALKHQAEYEAYYNPDFFIGEWKSETDSGSPLKIIKEDNNYYYVGGLLGKYKMSYNTKTNELKTNIGFSTLTIYRSGEKEITAYGKVYKKVK